jgi:hypothetical protein
MLMIASSAADRKVQSTMQVTETETPPKQHKGVNVKTILETDVCSRFIQKILWK